MTWHTVGLKPQPQTTLENCRGSLTEDDGYGDGDGDLGDGDGEGEGEGPGWEIDADGYGDAWLSGHYGHNNGDGESAP